MAYKKLNSRSVRLFVATPEDLEHHRPNLNAPYFRISKDAIKKLSELSDKTDDGDVVCGMSVWKRQGREGKPDYFTGEVSFPDDLETQNKYLAKDREWLDAHPKTERNATRKSAYMSKKVDVESEADLPF